ncbi:Sec-independent protein translocase protein TatB [Sphingomonas sp. GCM10030256]|uniref:Sec-independent protein translocase protein TatB n=1 Tax=Sphingomonas sp. GCM10030256 TaxID=3273427 RepID=UPI00361130E6
MFGVDTTELLIVAVAALIFIGPKDLPVAMRTVGRWVGKIRAHARHFTAGVETMMREAELEEMEKKWREENERIMREFPTALPYPGADPQAVMLPQAQPAAPLAGEEPQLPLGDPMPPPADRPLP